MQYRDPVLGLVFLAYAENLFESVRAAVEAGATSRSLANVADYRAKSVLYVSDDSRLSYLVNLPEGKDVGEATDAAIKAIEETNLELKDILLRGYQKLELSTLIEICLPHCLLSLTAMLSDSSTKVFSPTSPPRKERVVASTSPHTRSCV